MIATTSKFRKFIESLTKAIDAKRRQQLDNTPKRQKQVKSNHIEADHLDRVRVACLKIAEAEESGTLPENLSSIKTKTELLTMLKTEIECPSYYTIIDTGKFRDQSATAITLRTFLNSRQTAEEAQIKAEQEQQNKIRDLEAKVRFCPIPGFFPTPKPVIERMIALAGVSERCRVLEPSAGKGDIADALNKIGCTDVVCCEISPTLCDILTAKKHKVVCGDFIERFSILDPINEAGSVDPEMVNFDRVLMNPPFERNQDTDHIRHAYKLLKKGGRLVSVASGSTPDKNDRKTSEFREWLNSVGGDFDELPQDSFKGAFRSTGVSAILVIIDKN